MITDIINFFKDWLSKDQPLLNNIGIIIGLLAAIFGFLHVLVKLVKWLHRSFNRESLYRRLQPYFTKDEIQRATENYIPTQCQNVDPAVAAEPARVRAYATLASISMRSSSPNKLGSV